MLNKKEQDASTEISDGVNKTMADKEELKRVLRRGIRPDFHEQISEEQLEQAADIVLGIDRPTSADLEKTAERVTGHSGMFHGVEVANLQQALDEHRSNRAARCAVSRQVAKLCETS